LLNQVIGRLTDEQQKVLETVYRNSEELLELIDNVLWMTSLNAGDANATLEKFDPRDVINEAVKRHEKAIREKGLKIDIQVSDRDLSLVSDRAKVERIFQNVFNNAVKFTDEGEIKIKLESRSDQPGIDFEIIDTGIGIEESKLDSIFEPFHQTDSSTQRAHSGLGLGLTVARRMADLIGGTVTVNSKPGVGTRVMMRFPSQTSGSAALALHQRNYG